MRFLRSLAFLAISWSSLLAQSWVIGEPVVLDEHSVPSWASVRSSELQLAAGDHSYAVAWQLGDAGSSSEMGEWRMIALSPEGEPLRADPLRFEARDLRLVRRGAGFAVLTVEGSALNIRLVDSAGNHVAGPTPIHDLVNGYSALAAASNGSEIAVVWTEPPTRYDQPGRIAGVMIHPDGRVDHGVVRELTAPPSQPGNSITTHLAIESNGRDFLVLWSDCEKIGSWGIHTLSCSVTSRLIGAAGPELFPPSEILPAGYFTDRRPGLIASDGEGWIVLAEDAMVEVGSHGIVEKVCAAPWFNQYASQLAWDGRGFVLAETERGYGRYLALSRASGPCEPLRSRFALGTVGRFSGPPAIASLEDGRSLVASVETEAAGAVSHFRIVVRTVTVSDTRRRAVRR